MPPDEDAQSVATLDSVAGNLDMHDRKDGCPDTCITTLDQEDLDYAREFLNDDPETRSEQISSLRQFLQFNSYLNAHDDDETLLRFLRGCKFNQQRAREKIRNFYELRATSPEWYDLRDPKDEEIQKLLRMGIFIPLLKRDSATGQTVIIVRAALHNPRETAFNSILKVAKMVMEILTRQSTVLYIYGLRAVIDLEGVGLAHALQLTPQLIKKLVHTWQDCYPVRTRSIDFVNSPLHINMVLNIFRKFMNEKMRQRIHTHRTIKPLVSLINPEVLPVEYGGTGPKISSVIDYWRNEVSNNRDWYFDDIKYRANMDLKSDAS